MASIYKRTFKTEAGTTKSQIYFIDYTDENGARKTVSGFTDKAATKYKADDIERRVARIRAGMPVANEEKLQEPIELLTSEYLDSLAMEGRTDVHIKQTRRILERVIEATGFRTLAQIRPDPIVRLMHSTQGSARNKNIMRDYIVAFVNYCVHREWLLDNPLRKIQKARNPHGKKHNPRRAYTLEEINKLIKLKTAMESGRTAIYQVAAYSGLRRDELRRLQKRDVFLSQEGAYWSLRPEATKGKRHETLPMFPECETVIRKLIKPLKHATDRIFKTVPLHRTLMADITRAGIARRDDQGKHVDFHSFRLYFCTTISRVMPIQKVKVLMRHKDIKTTVNLYLDLGLKDMAEDVWKLPKLFQ